MPAAAGEPISIIEEASRRALAAELERCRAGGTSPEILINDAVLQEQERLRKTPRAPAYETRFWTQVGREFHKVSETERAEILSRILRNYMEEIHGGLDPHLHSLASRIIPYALKLLLNRFSPARVLWSVETRLSLEENLILNGPVDSLRALAGRGTLVLVPTHVSNLDSVVLGIGLHQSGFPPFTYGAGLNLFGNPILAYFLNRLGAYKVDRTKKNEVYKDALKHYATLTMERGRHHLFFPGGTRNRRGDVERHLKLGLLGCALSAYQSNLIRQAENPDVFIVPATLSYGLVLEAKSLIDEHLREEGKSRFIDVGDDFPRALRLLRFWRNLQSLDSKIHLTFGQPLDLFGNAVDAEGVSRDRQGRPVDRKSYVLKDGAVAPSTQRDQEYTRELGRSISDSFLKNNTALCTHAVAFAAFDGLRRASTERDFFRFLRFSGPEGAIPRSEVLNHLGRLLVQLRERALAGTLRIEKVLERDPETILKSALSQFRGYHDGKTLREGNGKVWSDDLQLLYYYRNRLDHYGLES